MEITEPTQVYFGRKMAAVETETSKVPTGVRLLLKSFFCDQLLIDKLPNWQVRLAMCRGQQCCLEQFYFLVYTGGRNKLLKN